MDSNPEQGILLDIIDIAERALWNPANVKPAEVQSMAAAVIAHLRTRNIDLARYVPVSSLNDETAKWSQDGEVILRGVSKDSVGECLTSRHCCLERHGQDNRT